jgi:hypothetical protein
MQAIFGLVIPVFIKFLVVGCIISLLIQLFAAERSRVKALEQGSTMIRNISAVIIDNYKQRALGVPTHVRLITMTDRLVSRRRARRASVLMRFMG